MTKRSLPIDPPSAKKSKTMHSTAANGGPVAQPHEIDEDLHSRQLAVYGRESMRRMAAANVLICGAGGLGAEIGGGPYAFSFKMLKKLKCLTSLEFCSQERRAGGCSSRDCLGQFKSQISRSCIPVLLLRAGPWQEPRRCLQRFSSGAQCSCDSLLLSGGSFQELSWEV